MKANRKLRREAAARRRRGDMSVPAKTDGGTPAECADYLLRDSVDSRVIVGPVCNYPEIGTAFIVNTCGVDGWRCDSISNDESGRAELCAAMVAWGRSNNRPLFLVSVDDEVEAAWLCKEFWPGDRIAEVFLKVQAEHASWDATKH